MSLEHCHTAGSLSVTMVGLRLGFVLVLMLGLVFGGFESCHVPPSSRSG